MTVRNIIEKKIQEFSNSSIESPKYVLLDDQTYFSLKEEIYGSIEAAISEELEIFEDLKVFHNNIGQTFIDVA